MSLYTSNFRPLMNLLYAVLTSWAVVLLGCLGLKEIHTTPDLVGRIPPNIGEVVVLGGDSRAQFGMDPKIFESVLGVYVLNLGGGRGDIVTLVDSLILSEQDFSKSTVVLSVSSPQLNDNLLNLGYLPEGYLVRSPLKVFFSTIFSDLRFFKKLVHDVWGSYLVRFGIRAKPFEEFREAFPTNIIDSSKFLTASDHPWYQSASYGGWRSKIFGQQLDKLIELTGKVIIVSNGFPDAYKKWSGFSEIKPLEAQFFKILHSICSKKSLRCIFEEELGDWPNTMYADEMHFNGKGIKKYSERLAYIIRTEL